MPDLEGSESMHAIGLNGYAKIQWKSLHIHKGYLYCAASILKTRFTGIGSTQICWRATA